VIKVCLILLLIVYLAVFAYMLSIGYTQGLKPIKEGLFLWTLGGVFGLMAYRISKRRKAKQRYFN
jgi:glycopeptide antibiotics resistance protein